MKESSVLIIEKPFSCDVDGCLMKFTNEDHLMVHKKRHDMVLNLGSGPKGNSFSDQTPTPTRFIRNCEEVGLFQDLQNVNPFEETFRKAVEAVKMGQTPLLEKEFQSSSADDTLHTPNVFPNINDLSCVHQNENLSIQEDRKTLEHPSKKDIEKDVNYNEKQTSRHIEEFQKVILGNINHKKRKCEILEKVFNNNNNNSNNNSKNNNNNCNKLVHYKVNGNAQYEKSSVNNNTVGLNQVHTALKEKIRNNIFNKQLPIILELKVPIPKSTSSSGYQKCLKDKFSTFSKNSLKFESKLEKQESGIFDLSKKRKLKNKNCFPKERIEILERNRAAATRCREKKKIYLLYLEKLTRDLTDANKKLEIDNTNLRKKISSLEEELLKHKNCSLTKSQEEKVLSLVHENLDESEKLLIKYHQTVNQSKDTINESDAVKCNYSPKSDDQSNKEQDSVNLGRNNNNKNTILIAKSGINSTKTLCEVENFRKIYSDHSYFDYSNTVDIMKKCMNSNVSTLKSTSFLASGVNYKYSEGKLDKLVAEMRVNSNNLNNEESAFNSQPLILLKPFNKRRSKNMDKA